MEFSESNTGVDVPAESMSDASVPPQHDIPKSLPSAGVENMLGTPAKSKKTADELATMILADLSEIEGCPGRGVKVVVYGYNPWNAWLSFGTDAGPVRNKAELDGFFAIIIERLKRLYDVAS